MIAPGRTFGRYQILREIGRGGMGAVFEASHTQLRKRVALKAMHAGTLDARAVERFIREGRAAASFAHPHVVDVWDLGVHEQTPFIVMELLEGEDLATRLAREAPLTVSAAIDLLLPVLSAVAAMHDKGVVHRDLKPENIFIARALGGEDHVKVLDFGVCLGGDADAHRLTDGGLVGTPSYSSPEQIEGASGAPASDQHALGVILYEALCARRPYEAPTLLGLLGAIRAGVRRPLRELRADLPAPLVVAVDRALSSDPAARFEDVRAFARAIVEFASEPNRSRWRAVFGDGSSTSEANGERERPRDATESFAAPLAQATARFGSPLSAIEASADEASADESKPAVDGRRATRAFAVTVALVAIALVAIAVKSVRAPQRRAEADRSASVAASRASEPRVEPRVARRSDEPPTQLAVTRVDAGAASERRAIGTLRTGRATRARVAPERATTPQVASQETAVNNAPIVD